MAEQKIDQLATVSTSTLTSSSRWIAEGTYTYQITGTQLREFVFNAVPYRSSESGAYVKLKANGNTAETPEEGDWRVGIDSSGNLMTDYYDGSSWKNKNKYNKG